MRKILTILIMMQFVLAACGKDINGTYPNDSKPDPLPDVKPVQKIDYERQYDPVADCGQFYFPQMRGEVSMYWHVESPLTGPTHNSPNETSITSGLQYNLLCQSLAGIVNRAYEEGRSDVYMWLEARFEAYESIRAGLGKEVGKTDAITILSQKHALVDGRDVNVRQLIKGYVLTDVLKNPESIQAASTASHVYDAIIVDVRDKEVFDKMGFDMLYDARNKSTADAWHEFKDKCSNEALVVMPVQTGELREYAIKNRLFTININKKFQDASAGQNNALFDEILAWLKPNSPVLGWEGGVGESLFVSKVSSYGHLMQPADWSYNTSLTSFNYKSRQKQTLAKVINPRDIDYDKKGDFVSFFLSDGDNYQVMLKDGYIENLLYKKSAAEYNVSFGMCCATLSQLAPDRLVEFLSRQRQETTVMETFGCGYFYADTYSEKGNRQQNLKILAKRIADHMRQHRLKILHLMTLDNSASPAAMEAYKAFIEANDQLEGIVVIQYSPYNGGYGRTYWATNTEGYDIPIVTSKYSIWDLRNSKWQCPPTELACVLDDNATGDSHSLVCIHAWSKFDGGISGPDAAKACMESLHTKYHAVSVQELIWRIRMKERRDQTLKYISTLR